MTHFPQYNTLKRKGGKYKGSKTIFFFLFVFIFNNSRTFETVPTLNDEPVTQV